MKTRNVIIVLLIGIIAGYTIRMVIKSNESSNNIIIKSKTILKKPKPIDRKQALKKKNNYEGKKKDIKIKDRSDYIILNDEILDSLIAVRSVYSTGNSFLIYFASDTKAEDYNEIVVTRISYNPKEESTKEVDAAGIYFSIPTGGKKIRICPPMCDIRQLPFEELPTPSDSTNTENGKEEEEPS